MRAPFIVIEGIDGSGKTLQCAMLVAALRATGRYRDVVSTCEPTRAGPVGKLIRATLRQAPLAGTPEGTSGPWRPGDDVMALLFAADRLDHVTRVVAPALDAGHAVVSDRYYYSSLAYQQAADGAVTAYWVGQLNAHARAPDLTVVLRVPPAAAAARRAARGGDPERYEHGELQARVARAYDRIHTLAPGDTIAYVDGEGTPAQVAARVWEHVERMLEGRMPQGVWEAVAG